MSNQQAFSGWVLPPAVGPSPAAGSLVLNALPSGAVDGSNKLFALSVNFSDISVYLNGVKLVRGTDFTCLACPTGPGYDRFRMTVAPEGGDQPDVLTADLVAA